MATALKQYFPMLKERETLLAEIKSKPELKNYLKNGRKNSRGNF